MKTIGIFFVAVGCSLLLNSCKKKEGVLDIPQNAPRLLSASVQPTSVHIDSNRIDVDSLGNDTYRIRVNISAEAIDADGAGDIGTASYVITSPRSTTPLSTGIVPLSSVWGDTARFADSVSFVMMRSDAGVIAIAFQALDNGNLASNSVSLPLLVNRNNSRPELSNSTVPDTIYRPATGFRVYLFNVAASDSDGYSDIAEVTFQRILPSPRGPFTMFDDGNGPSHGDELVGDGIFSERVLIDSSAFLGDQTFAFLARDRFGAYSDSLFRTVIVVPE